MTQFKNETIACGTCKKMNFVKKQDFETGFYTCVHNGCGAKNVLTENFYDPNIVDGLPGFGALVATDNPTERYQLAFGTNAVGRGMQANVRVLAKTHNGLTFVSRQHCTITVSFDKWIGQLHTTIRDGVMDASTGAFNASQNHTYKNNKKIESVEEVYLKHHDTINLGGGDSFRVEAYTIPMAMLETYLKTIKKDPEGTLQ